jgi:adenosylcobinamide kinase/adenosylcobinamide-phosphate guanylyltransferase
VRYPESAGDPESVTPGPDGGAAPGPQRILVLGGARSGKSRYAERLASDDAEVVYAATAPRYEGDAEWDERIARHRRDRPAGWRTVEVTDHPSGLAGLLREPGPTLLVDCLTLWLTAAMDAADAWNDEAWRDGRAPAALEAGAAEAVAAFERAPRRVIAVSNEIGFGLVPESAGSRRFRDALGRLNQSFAEHADQVTLVVAGLPLSLKEPIAPARGVLPGDAGGTPHSRSAQRR